MSAGEWRLYWSRVRKSFDTLFSDKRRSTWADAAAAEARATAIRQGKRTPRQQQAAAAAIKVVTSELRPKLPRGPRAQAPGSPAKATTGPSAFLTSSASRVIHTHEK